MVAGLGSVVSVAQLSGASPLPPFDSAAVKCGQGLAPDEAFSRAANQPASHQTPPTV